MTASAINFDAVPSELKARKQWVLRGGKDGKTPINADGKSKGWNEPEFWMSFDSVRDAYQKDPKKYAGIGFIASRQGAQTDPQLQLGDLDCCRDPVTGKVSSWAKSILDQINGYTELSPSLCGFRFINLGNLPNELGQITGRGPDNLTDEMKAHIIAQNFRLKRSWKKAKPPLIILSFMRQTSISL